MKPIKFDLLVNGKKVKNIQELRDNFTTEILEYFRDGRLAKWLQARNMNTELLALTALKEMDEHALLKKLCEIFKIEADDFMISAIKQVARLEQVEAAMQQIESEAEAVSAECIVLNENNPACLAGGIGTFRIKARYECIAKLETDKQYAGAVSCGGLIYALILQGDDGESATPAYQWLATSRDLEMLGQRVTMLLDNKHERYKLSGSQARNLDATLTKSFNRLLRRQLSIEPDVLELGSYSNDIIEAISIMGKRSALTPALAGLRKAEAEFITNHTYVITGEVRNFAIDDYEMLINPRELSKAEKESIEMLGYPAMAVQLALNGIELDIDLAMGQTCALVKAQHQQLITLAETLTKAINPFTRTHARVVISTLDGYSFEIDKGLLGDNYYLVTRRNPITPLCM